MLSLQYIIKQLKYKIMKTITLSAYSQDYSEKAYKFYFGQNNFEFVPKSQVKFIEEENGSDKFTSGVKSRYFSLPIWLAKKLKGLEFYGI